MRSSGGIDVTSSTSSWSSNGVRRLERVRHREAVGHQQKLVRELRRNVEVENGVARAAAAALVEHVLEQGRRRRARPPQEAPLLRVGEVVRGRHVVAADVARAQARQATELERDEAPVVPEQLVAAGAGERDLHVAAHEAEDVPRGKAAAVRLVERPHHREEVVEQLACVDHELVVRRAVALRERTRERELVQRVVLVGREPERVRAQVGVARLREQAHDGARVEPARERARDRDVGEAPARDRCGKRGAQPLDPRVAVEAVVRLEREPVPAAGLGLARLEVDLERMARRQALDTREDRLAPGTKRSVR